MPNILNFKVVVEQDGDGYFVASVPAIPGCHTQGKTYEEAVNNIKEVIDLCLEEAEIDIDYRNKINWPTSVAQRFLGIIDLAIRRPRFAI